MRKWSARASSSQTGSMINRIASQLLGGNVYQQWAMPAIFTMILGATKKWQ